MDFIKGLLIVIGIATVASVIIGTIKDCRGTNEIYYDPCMLEVGQEIEVMAYEKTANKYIELQTRGCDYTVILRIIGVPPQRQIGGVTKFKVIKVNNDYFYDVEAIKPEKDTAGYTPTKP